MKKIIKCLIFILLLFSFNTQAQNEFLEGDIFPDTCTKEFKKPLDELAKLVEYEKNYSIELTEDPDYVNGYKEALWNIKLYNLDPKLKISYSSSNYGENDLDKNKDTITKLTGGEEYNIKIYSYTKECPLVLLRTINIKTGILNPYLESEECKNNKDFKFCNEVLDNKITDSQFKLEYKKYINSNKKNDNSNNNEPSKSKDNKFIIIFIILIVLLLIITIILIITNKNKKKGIEINI